MARLKIFRVLALGVILGLGACSDGGSNASVLETGPIPGTLAVAFSTPFQNDGAVSLELRGEAIENLRAADAGMEILTRQVGEAQMVAVLGVALSGEILTFDVPDIRDPGAYTVTLVEVADEANELRRDLTDYSLTLTPTR